jgi:hypothetical protein
MQKLKWDWTLPSSKEWEEKSSSPKSWFSSKGKLLIGFELGM